MPQAAAKVDTYTRKQWSLAYLKGLGNKNPSVYTLNWLISWTQFETGGPPGAYFNLLNTTQPGHGGYIGQNIQGPARAAGVKDYPTFKDGIDANVQVTENGLYPHLFRALVSNDHGSLAGPTHEIIKELSLWGTGHGRDIATMAANPSQLRPHEQFPGKATGVPAGSGPPGTASGVMGTVANAVQNVHIAPAEQVAQLFAAMDTALKLTNPFVVSPTPEFDVNLPFGQSAVIPDPLAYAGDVAQNFINNASAFFVRAVFLTLGLALIIVLVQSAFLSRVNEFLEPVGGVSGAVEKIGAVA